MLLASKFIIRVTISINGPIKLFESHERVDKFIIGVQKSTKPLFRLDKLNLLHAISKLYFEILGVHT